MHGSPSVANLGPRGVTNHHIPGGTGVGGGEWGERLRVGVEWGRGQGWSVRILVQKHQQFYTHISHWAEDCSRNVFEIITRVAEQLAGHSHWDLLQCTVDSDRCN